MYKYRIDLDSQNGEVKTVSTKKQLNQAYAGWYAWADDVKGQSFSFSYFTAWNKKGEVIIIDIA